MLGIANVIIELTDLPSRIVRRDGRNPWLEAGHAAPVSRSCSTSRVMDIIGNRGWGWLGINSPRARVCNADHAVQSMGRHGLLAGR